MRLTFLGKETQGGGSPTLFATDRDTYVVQGWKVAGEAASVEIPPRLLGHLEQGPAWVPGYRTAAGGASSCPALR